MLGYEFALEYHAIERRCRYELFQLGIAVDNAASLGELSSIADKRIPATMRRLARARRNFGRHVKAIQKLIDDRVAELDGEMKS